MKEKSRNIKYQPFATVSIIIAWFLYMFSYIARVEPGVIVNDLMSEFHINSSIVGFIVSIVYIPYVAIQIPAGLITDKFGARMVLTISAFICSLGVFIFGSASTILGLEVGRSLIGISVAPVFLCCSKIAGDMFDNSKYALLMGIAMLTGCLGGILGTALTSYLISFIAWRNLTYIIAGIGLVITLLAYFFIKDVQPKKDEKKENLLEGLKILIRNPKAWLLGLYGAVTYLPLSAIAELWVIPFMELRYGIATKIAAFASTVIFMGFGLGGIITAYIAERIGSYKKTIIFTTIGLLISIYMSLYNESISFSTNLVILFFVGIFAGTNTLCFTLAYDLVPKQYAGISTGFMNTIIMSSGIVFLPLLGKLLDFFRNGMVKEDGSPLYDITMYKSSFLVIIGSTIIAVIVTFFIEEIKKYRANI